MLSLAGLGERTVPSYSNMLAKVEAYIVDTYLRTVLDNLPASSSSNDLDAVIMFHSLSGEGTTMLDNGC